MDEREAIQDLKAGQLRGLAYLVRAHQTEAMRAAALITGDPAAAEDLVQAAFLRFAEKPQAFDSSRSFKPYFMKMVVNDAIKLVQRQKPEFSLDEKNLEDGFDLLDPKPLPEAIIETRQAQEQVRAALAKLPPKQRAVIVLRHYLEFSESEIRDMIGSPLGTIKWRLFSARTRLVSLLRANAVETSLDPEPSLANQKDGAKNA